MKSMINAKSAYNPRRKHAFFFCLYAIPAFDVSEISHVQSISVIPPLSKISESRNDVCLLVEALVNPTCDLHPGPMVRQDHEGREDTYYTECREFAAKVPQSLWRGDLRYQMSIKDNLGW
jgi:hypothetical protein